MDIFKFIYEHDLRLEQLADNHDPRKETKRPSTLEEFLKPVQTYSSFYLTGTRFPDQHFGLNVLEDYSKLLSAFTHAIHAPHIISQNKQYDTLKLALDVTEPGDTIVLSKSGLNSFDFENNALFDRSLSVREKIPMLKNQLDAGRLVIFVEKAHHGFDLYLFSKENIYESFFTVFKPLLSNTFRFFSINGKRSKSERLFYFETWSLDRPPHGFEEVFPETVLR